ncbi:MAG TPA: peptidylprolyl isomerase [Methyloceanibacter sp.]
MVRKVLREPLVHFLALALLIFVAYGILIRSDTTAPGRIVITQAKIEQITGLFARTWQRPPTPAELKGLIDDYVREEVYYREALKLGLDADDVVIRRRLRQKMEFLSEAASETLRASEADLAEYLNTHAYKFAIESAVAFRQIYFNPERRGDKTSEDATTALAALHSDASLDPASVGDATLLPSELPLTSKATISQTFGASFADEIIKATPGTWAGPVKSSFGLHIVRVSETKPSRMPMLTEVRETVERDWASNKRKALADRRFNELLKQYDIAIEPEPKAVGQASASP